MNNRNPNDKVDVALVFRIFGLVIPSSFDIWISSFFYYADMGIWKKP